MPYRVGVDKWLFFITMVLVVTGLVMVFSASAVVAQERFHSPYAYLGRQAIWVVAGMAALFVLMHIDVSHFNSSKFIGAIVCATTLLLVMVYFFPGSHNTHRWIRFGGQFTFQPSELAKPVLVLFLSWFLSTRLDAMNNWRHTLGPAILMPLIFIVLVVCEPDLGTAIVLFGVTAMMFFLAGLAWKYLLAGLCVALPILAGLLIWVPWRLQRMLVFFNLNCDAKDAGGAAGYHVCQSLIAVGTGGLTGRGYMEGMQKLFYLPESSTDFIFANIAEELGFAGAIFILGLFIALGVRGMRAGFRSKDPFARLTAFGITTAILLQAFFNISVVIALVPTKGIPLPLISSGGTSVLVTLASIGILLNISKKVE
ncbi:MAG: putative lipid II flippase FtsW [Terracidiphilus sp.]